MPSKSPPGGSSAARCELIDTDRVRIGLVHAPCASTFFVAMERNGAPSGVTVALGEALAQSLGLPVAFAVKPNSGEITDALENGSIDIAFMPRDEERERRVDFGPDYFLIESTGLVHDDSAFRTTADLDRPDVRLVAIANTTTHRGAARKLPKATILPTATVKEALDRLMARQADAIVLSRDVLASYRAGLPGTRLLDGAIHTTGVAVAVRKGHPAMLAHVAAFMLAAKRSGLLRRVFNAAGFASEPVAPVAERDLVSNLSPRC